MIRYTIPHYYSKLNQFYLSGAIWFMNVQTLNAKQRLYTVSSIMKPSLDYR